MANGDEPKNDGRYTGGEAAITYRYLRFGMVAMVVLLVVSVLVERTRAPGCWQTSLSAYYYTPVHSVFVGALVAIGLCLVVIRGLPPWLAEIALFVAFWIARAHEDRQSVAAA